MCLGELKRFKVEPTHTDGSVKGWKVFGVACGQLKSQYYDRHYTPKKEWNVDDAPYNISIFGCPGGFKMYPSGFHVFTTKAGANRWNCSSLKTAVVPVYYMPKDVVAKGIQQNKKVVVVKRMWIEPHDYDAAVK